MTIPSARSRVPAEGGATQPPVVEGDAVAAALWTQPRTVRVASPLADLQPLYVVSGADALQAFADPNRVELPPVVLPPECLGALVRDGAAGVARTDHRIFAEPGIGLQHGDIASALARLRQNIDEILSGWAKRGIFSISLQLRAASWRLVTWLVLGAEAEARHLADFELHFHAERPDERAEADRRYSAWLDGEASRIAAGRQAAGKACFGARLAASGKLSHAELVDALDAALVQGMRVEAPIAALLHRLCLDRALFAEVRTEVQALANVSAFKSIARTPRLAELIAEASRTTAVTPLLYARLKTDGQIDGVAIRKGATLIAAF